MKIFVVIAFAIVIYGSCDKSGQPIGAPALEPPVEATKPKGMSSGTTTSLTCPDCQTPLEVIKSRLFSAGETNFQYRLRMIDERMAELNTRSQETARKCVSSTATEWNPPAMPGDASFPMYFNCHEQLNASSQLAFGFNGDDFYLAELQQSANDVPGIAVLAKSNKAGNKLEVWQILNDNDDGETFSVMHIFADVNEEKFEVSVGGTAEGTGLSCGVQMSANSEYIYASGIFAVNSSNGGNDGCKADDENYPLTTICASADSLAELDDGSSCTDASLEDFQTVNHGNGSTMTYDQALSIINAVISGIGDFNENQE